MTKPWRPEDWETEHYYGGSLTCLVHDFGEEYQIFEAGADAMLKALRKTGYKIKEGESFGDKQTGARTIVKVDGVIAFIPG